jgi:hypothetical protein
MDLGYQHSSGSGYTSGGTVEVADGKEGELPAVVGRLSGSDRIVGLALEEDLSIGEHTLAHLGCDVKGMDGLSTIACDFGPNFDRGEVLGSWLGRLLNRVGGLPESLGDGGGGGGSGWPARLLRYGASGYGG